MSDYNKLPIGEPGERDYNRIPAGLLNYICIPRRAYRPFSLLWWALAFFGVSRSCE